MKRSRVCEAHEVHRQRVSSLTEEVLNDVEVTVVSSPNERRVLHLHSRAVGSVSCKVRGRPFRRPFRLSAFSFSHRPGLLNVSAFLDEELHGREVPCVERAFLILLLTAVEAHAAHEACCSIAAPFPAARSSGGSPQWSDSLSGAPCTTSLGKVEDTQPHRLRRVFPEEVHCQIMLQAYGIVQRCDA